MEADEEASLSSGTGRTCRQIVEIMHSLVMHGRHLAKTGSRLACLSNAYRELHLPATGIRKLKCVRTSLLLSSTAFEILKLNQYSILRTAGRQG